MNAPPIWIDAEDHDVEEDVVTITQAGKRMRRKRRREKNARLFWEIKLKSGTSYLPLIEDSLKNAPSIVEAARIATIKRNEDFARAYPERCAELSI